MGTPGGRMTSTANHFGRVGKLATALEVVNVWRAGARMTVSIGAAALVVAATAGPGSASTASPEVQLSADATALLVCGTTCPSWHDTDVEIIMNQFITPSHPAHAITPVAVTTPSEAWPITGIFRLLGLPLGDQSFFGSGGAAWPDVPWWKLSGLFDLTTNQSVRAGVADLEQAMALYGNNNLVIYGYSQGAVVTSQVRRKLAAQYPAGTAPDIDFVLGGDFDVPNGGLHARFPGLYIPFLDWSFDGPEPTDTQFDTVVVTRQYDGVSDFPLYPLNVIADLNALLGFLYVHSHPFDVSLADGASEATVSTDPTGRTSYYFFETKDLPLFGPFRTLGVPEPLIDVIEPFFRVLVELGYDRAIPAWEPTPARLFPVFNPVEVALDLINAIGEGINNALAVVGLPPLLSASATVSEKTPSIETATAIASHRQVTSDVPPQIEPTMSTATETSSVAPATEAVEAGIPQQGAPDELETEADQTTPADTATDAPQPMSVDNTDAITSGPADASELSTASPDVSTGAVSHELTKPAGQPKRVVRDSLAVGRQSANRSDRGQGDQLTTRTAADSYEASDGKRSAVESAPDASSTGDSGGDES